MKRKVKKLKVKNKRRFITFSLITFIILFSLGYKICNINHENKTFSKQETSKNPSTSSSTDKETIKNNTEDTKVSIKSTVKNTNTNILLSSVGDCSLGRDNNYSYENSLVDVFKKNNNNYAYFFKNVYSILKNDDITTANLEGTFTESTEKASKKFTFKGPKDYAKILTSGSIEGVNISNNHIYDYLAQGFQDTKKALKDENIPFFGEDNVWKTEVKGIKFAFLGYRGFYASENFLKTLSRDITPLKKEGYIVIINFHWGKESSYHPCDTQKKIAHYSIDNGADLIIGHHPHVIQGIEKYKNKLICYSLGNFCFGGNKNPRDKTTMIVQFRFNFINNKFSSYDFKVIPCRISSVNYKNDYCPTPLKYENAKSLLNNLNDISFNLNFTIDGTFHNIKL